MDDHDFERTVQVIYLIAYCVGLAAMIALLMPGVRERLTVWPGQARDAWRYGRYLGRRKPPPQWVDLLLREDLPVEQ